MTTARNLATTPLNNGYLYIRIRYRTIIGVGLSLLVHALLMLGMLNNKIDIEGGPVLEEQSPITLLLPPAPTPRPQPKAAVPTPPTPPKAQPRPAPKPAPRVVRPAPPRETVAAVTPAPPTAVREPEPPPAADMSSMIEAARERRRATADAAAPPVAAAPSDNSVAMANIQHSMKSQSRRKDGTSGVFQVLNKGVRTAQLTFHGWTPESNREISQSFNIDAGLQGDVDRAVVRKMIELIRQHYPGDFNWDSRRLGRVVVLSARLGDNTALESFLLREFFTEYG